MRGICVKPGSGQGCPHCFSESTILSVSGKAQTPHASPSTEGDSNTPPNPPLTALLTQSIPCGVGFCRVAIAKLSLLW